MMIKPNKMSLWLALGVLLLSVACLPVTTGEDVESLETAVPGETQPAQTPAAESPTEEGATPMPTTGAEYTDLPRGEVPADLFDAVLSDLLAQTGAAAADVVVLKSEQVVWNDGSLGCPQPGMMYTQALVDGYQVVFEVAGGRFDYHLSNRGDFVLCENELPPGSPSGTPTQ